MNLSENFTVTEFTKSQTAARLGIDNMPTPEHLENAKRLFENVVQRVRDHFGSTTINSGYRGAALNKAVGGASTSQHCNGEAADIEVPGVANYDVALWIEQNCEYDQLILEAAKKDDPAAGWVHVSYKEGKNRKQSLTAVFVNGKPIYSNGLGVYE
jgi:hypothetical protein